MAKGINKVILIGNLGQDPEVKYFPNGDAFCNFSIATSESWTDKNSGEKKERTEWHSCVATRKLAEIIGQYLSKGSKIYVEGSLRTRKWQDKQGVDKYTTEIVVNEMQMLDGKASDGGGGKSSRPAPARPETRGRAPAAQPQGAHFEDDDIPF